MDRAALKKTILETISEVADMNDVELLTPIEEDTVLLETGLDSLGFATVVASLDLKLGYDPFAAAEDAYYPRTLKEFVDFYHQHGN